MFEEEKKEIPKEEPSFAEAPKGEPSFAPTVAEAMAGKKATEGEPEDIFTEARVEEKPTEKIEPAVPTIPREFIREKKGFPKILILIIILLVLVGAGFLLASSGILKFEKQERPLVNQPMIIPETPPVTQPQILDSDNDGLTDEEEMALGTNPNLVDSDDDGLTDKEEAEIYQTNPLNPDTDNDGYKDGEETLNGYDPKDPTPGAKLLDLQAEIKKIQE